MIAVKRFKPSSSQDSPSPVPRPCFSCPSLFSQILLFYYICCSFNFWNLGLLKQGLGWGVHICKNSALPHHNDQILEFIGLFFYIIEFSSKRPFQRRMTCKVFCVLGMWKVMMSRVLENSDFLHDGILQHLCTHEEVISSHTDIEWSC